MPCPVCLEGFDALRRRPKITPCGHTFCLPCLENNRLGSSRCPTCRQVIVENPAILTDNFFALEVPRDTQDLLNRFWCFLCHDVPRLECLDSHDVRLALPFAELLQRTVDEQIGEELAQVTVMNGKLSKTAVAFNALLTVLSRSDAAVSAPVVRSGSDAAGALRRSKESTREIKEGLKLLNASEAQLRVRTSDGWVSFSADLPVEGQQEEGDEDLGLGDMAARMLPFAALALSQHQPLGLRKSSALVVRASVHCDRTGPLDDIEIEMVELPTSEMARKLAGRSHWRPYDICKGCLESCDAEEFRPLPQDGASALVPVELGTVCFGRSTGRYYFVLCADIAELQAKFLLPLETSFKVLGRVTANFSSLRVAAKALRAGETMEIRFLSASE